MRKLNTELLRQWLVINGPLSKEDLAARARIKFFTLERILRGARFATEIEQVAISRVTEIDRDELFPVRKQEAVS
jgi:hypothetical protein